MAKMYFGDDGALHNGSDATASEKIEALVHLLRLFNAGLASCTKTQAGDYCLIDKNSGYRSGLEVLWRKISSLALFVHMDSYHDLNEEEQQILTEKGTLVRTPKMRFNATPLASVVYRLAFLIPWKSTTEWVTEIPKQTVDQLRATIDELVLHKTDADLEHSTREVTLERIKTEAQQTCVSASGPDRADKLKWPTRSDLRKALKLHRTTVGVLLRASGFESKLRGGAASSERISPTHVLRLRRSLLNSNSPERDARIAALARWSDFDPQLDKK